MKAAQVNSNPSTMPDAVSALVDGELDSASLDMLLASVDKQSQVMADWHAYQLIGDVLRGSSNSVGVQRPADFLAGVRERLKAEEVAHAAVPAPARVLVSPAAPVQVSVQAPAANDAVFRWKMVAGFASLAAVMAVSWSVINGAPSGVDGSAGPQLASATPPAAPVVVVSVPAQGAQASSSTEVVIQTGQGPLIRDARLEELLAEHRQHGGMSALQMPTGFIRGATYDASGR